MAAIRTKQRSHTYGRRKQGLLNEGGELHSARGRVKFFHKICMSPCGSRVQSEPPLPWRSGPSNSTFHTYTHTHGKRSRWSPLTRSHNATCLYLRPWSHDMACEKLNNNSARREGRCRAQNLLETLHHWGCTKLDMLSDSIRLTNVSRNPRIYFREPIRSVLNGRSFEAFRSGFAEVAPSNGLISLSCGEKHIINTWLTVLNRTVSKTCCPRRKNAFRATFTY